MEIWFLRDMERLDSECDAIEALVETTDWLEGTKWNLEADLCVDAVIRIRDHRYEVRLTYPSLFPAVPPVVRPKETDARWSTHQYNDGTLCLEWGPDNWHPEVTGAQLLTSVFNLLDTENPPDTSHPIIAPSRHRLSIGQALRSFYGRFFWSAGVQTHLRANPKPAKGSIEFLLHSQSRSMLVFICKVQLEGTPEWEDLSIPSILREPGGSSHGTGFFCKTGMDPANLEGINTMGDLCSVLSQCGHGELLDAPRTSLSGVLLLDLNGQPHFFLSCSPDNEQVFRLGAVCSDGADTASRIPTDLEGFSNTSVAVVGLGSVGSKVALSLARTGVPRFLLVDHDIFLPENLCRHVLNWNSIGEHKVDAVAENLKLVCSHVDVEVSRLHLTGQESTAALDGVLRKLGQADLLIDATANAEAFNILAATAVTYQRPIVWMAVYAGGIGGMVARSRPGIDPDPYTMRDAYRETVTQGPPLDFVVGSGYAAERTDGETFAATDADVAVLASHTCRLALDTLVRRSSSIFPYSMYLIGLNESWIFEQPFDTRPVATDHLPKHWDQCKRPMGDGLPNALKLLSEILAEQHNEDTSD